MIRTREDPARRLWQLWLQGQQPDLAVFLSEAGPLEPVDLAATLRVDQRQRWQRGQRILTEQYLRAYPPVAADQEAALDLAYAEFLLRQELGDTPTPEEYLQRFPQHADQLRLQFEFARALPKTLPASTSCPNEATSTGPDGSGTIEGPAVPLPALDGKGPVEEPAIPGYQLLGKLGQGGMGIVYKARQAQPNRLVALKMLLGGGQAREAGLVRFRTEAEAMARLQHANIAQVHEFGEHQGQPYFTMEFCAAGNLEQRLRAAPLTPPQAAQLLQMLARAVQAAHQANILHRDLKPANVLLAGSAEAALEQCVPKISDFGLAKQLDAVSGQTASGDVLGTPSYMAPEQTQGQGRAALGPAVDVYGLGAILYETLTGRPPFRAARVMDTLLQVLHEEPVPPHRFQPHLPRDLETICLKCLRKSPSQRYASAADLADDLQRFLNHEPIRARPTSLLEKTGKWVQRRPGVACLLAMVVLLLVVGAALVTWQWRQAVAALQGERRAQRDRALMHVEALLSANSCPAPGLLESLPKNHPHVVERLEEEWHKPNVANRPIRHIRAGLALLPTHPDQVRDDLVAWMLKAEDPAEVLIIRHALKDFRALLAPELWRQLQEPNDAEKHLRLLVALAAFDPDNPRWPEAAAAGIEPLLSANPLHLGRWVEHMRLVRSAWLAPVSEVFRGRKLPDRREVAASVLADFASDNLPLLTDLLLDADSKQHAILFPLVLAQREKALELLRQELTGPPPLPESEVNRWAARQANAAATLARLGELESAWKLLRHGPDPTVRSLLIERLTSRGVAAEKVLSQLEKERDPSARRALVLVLGGYGPDQLPETVREPCLRQLLDWYRHDPDAGLHGAIDWLLRHGKEGPLPRPLNWDQAAALDAIECELAQPGSSPPRTGAKGLQPGWWVNSHAQTFTVIPGPVEFLMGSPADEMGRLDDEEIHSRRIGRPFALATKTVTVRQFLEFLKAYPEVRHVYTKRFSPDPEGPMISVTWYEAMQYCRWLSEQEDVPEDQMCYPTVAEIEKSKDGVTPLKPRPDYLKRTGYRLPTEAEWEYACRAGARTSRHFGSDESLLARYAWYWSNAQDRTWPVGQKRPNDLGCFDLHGNVWNWCHAVDLPESPSERARIAEDRGFISDLSDHLGRSLRGGSFFDHAHNVRAASRNPYRPPNAFTSVGLRLARTCR